MQHTHTADTHTQSHCRHTATQTQPHKDFITNRWAMMHVSFPEYHELPTTKCSATDACKCLCIQSLRFHSLTHPGGANASAATASAAAISPAAAADNGVCLLHSTDDFKLTPNLQMPMVWAHPMTSPLPPNMGYNMSAQTAQTTASSEVPQASPEALEDQKKGVRAHCLHLF